MIKFNVTGKRTLGRVDVMRLVNVRDGIITNDAGSTIGDPHILVRITFLSSSENFIWSKDEIEQNKNNLSALSPDEFILINFKFDDYKYVKPTPHKSGIKYVICDEMPNRMNTLTDEDNNTIINAVHKYFDDAFEVPKSELT